jgi:hypothetical protein
MSTALQTIAEQKRFGNGKSKAAGRRRVARAHNEARIHSGKPGDTVEIGDCQYRVAADGSFRRL